MSASRALEGVDRVAVERPEWAGTVIPHHRRRLPLIVKEAVERPSSAATADRLSTRSREWGLGSWTGERAEARERAAAIRRRTLPDLEQHLERLTEQLTSRGAHVYRAADTAEALAAVDSILEPHDVDLVVKSKSMVTEEIHLNAHLEARGISVVETDLGEYIVQVADERPSHIVAPAVHLSRQDVRARFSALAGEDLGSEPDDLARFARERLREDFRRADVGISGVNFAVAETGTLCLVTNEGNADMVTSQPRVHIAIMTVEKVVADAEALSTLLPMLSKAGANQAVTVYQTFVNGPRLPDESDGPDELHLVILDNGRSALLGTRYEEVLACIRCGACQTACPVFATTGGGHAYANVYGGPIGAVLTPLLSQRPEDRDLAYLSSLCGACGDACPVKIPLPDMLVDLRTDYQQDNAGVAGRAGWLAWSTAWANPVGYTATKLVARLAGRVPQGLLGRLPMARQWAGGRTLPSTKGAGRRGE